MTTPVFSKEGFLPNEREHRDPWLVNAEKQPSFSRSRLRPWLSVIALATQPALNAAVSPISIDKALARMIEEETVITDEEIALGVAHTKMGDDLEEVLVLNAGLRSILEKPNEEGEENGNNNGK